MQAPEVDWRAITDPSERRRQRRLAKNRVTAARSRERKKAQWSVMEERLSGLEQENTSLRAALERVTRDNAELLSRLDRLVGGVGAGCSSSNGAPGAPGTTNNATTSLPGKGNGNTEPAVLIFIATLLLMCSLSLSGEQVALVAGGAIPLLLMLDLLRQAQQAASAATTASAGDPATSQQDLKPALTQPPVQALTPPSSCVASPLSHSLISLLISLKTLLSRTNRRLRKSVHRLLFERHHFVPRGLFSAAAVAGERAMSALQGVRGKGAVRTVRIKIEPMLISC